MATFHYFVVILLACSLIGTESASREPPVLNWIPRSDWINVKTNFAAVGNGIADDTNALQAAIDSLNDTSPGTLYFPPGTYKITRTLWMINKQFSTLIGHGGKFNRYAPIAFAHHIHTIRSDGDIVVR